MNTLNTIIGVSLDVVVGAIMIAWATNADKTQQKKLDEFEMKFRQLEGWYNGKSIHC